MAGLVLGCPLPLPAFGRDPVFVSIRFGGLPHGRPRVAAQARFTQPQEGVVEDSIREPQHDQQPSIHARAAAALMGSVGLWIEIRHGGGPWWPPLVAWLTRFVRGWILRNSPNV